MSTQDNILPKLMSTSGSYEELFKVELAKYDHIFEEVNKNVQLQEQLLEEIKVENPYSFFQLPHYAYGFRTLARFTHHRTQAELTEF